MLVVILLLNITSANVNTILVHTPEKKRKERISEGKVTVFYSLTCI